MDQNVYIGKEIGNYRITTELAGGAFGNVYKGEHIHLKERIVAIKLMRHASLRTKEERNTFLEEARVQEKLKHRFILPILDAGISEEIPYLIIEYAPNGTLSDRLKKQSQDPLPLQEALIILSQIGQALHYAHQQKVVHRDLKPQNILFKTKDEALLADFGIAKVLDSKGTMQSKHVVGTLPYMAPEQFTMNVSPRSDQYSLGCIAYELVTGQKPFMLLPDAGIGAWYSKHTNEPPIPPRHHNPDLPIQVEQAILKALQKERDNRYADVLTFIAALNIDAPTGSLQAPAFHSYQKTSELWIKEGNKLYDSQQYEEAIDAYKQALHHGRNNGLAYNGIGNALYGLGRYEDALAAYEQALHLNPNDFDAYNGKGAAFHKLKRYQEAIDVYEQALHLNPNDVAAVSGRSRALAAAYHFRGNTHYGRGHYEEAIAAYEQALNFNPIDVDTHNDKGAALHKLKRYKEAIAAYEQALHLNPNDAAATHGSVKARAAVYHNEGKTLYNHRRYQEAIDAYEQALHLNPNNYAVYTEKGNALYKLERYEEALAAYKQALHFAPNFAPDLKMGFTFDKLKRYEATIHFVPAFKMGLTLDKLKRYEDALVAYEQALHFDRRDVTAHIQRGDTLYQLKRYEEALVAYEIALNFYYRNVKAYIHKGDALRKLQRSKEAMLVYRQAFSKSEDAEPLIKEGDIHYEFGQYKLALHVYERALRGSRKGAAAYAGGVEALEAAAYAGRVKALTAIYDRVGVLEKLLLYLLVFEVKMLFYVTAIPFGLLSLPILSLIEIVDLNVPNWEDIFPFLKKKELAERAYRRDGVHDPNNVAAPLNAGHILYALKRYEEALSAYEQALALDPAFSEAHVGKAYALNKLNRSSEAQQASERARELGWNIERIQSSSIHSADQLPINSNSLPSKLKPIFSIRQSEFCLLCLLSGLGSLTSILTQSWFLAIGVVALITPIAYILVYKKVIHLYNALGMAILSVPIAFSIAVLMSYLNYDQVQISQLWFGITERLWIRGQLALGLLASGLSLISSYCFIYCKICRTFENYNPSFESYKPDLGRFDGTLLLIAFLDLYYGLSTWFLVALLALFGWGFGFGFGWAFSLLALAIGIVCSLGLASTLAIWTAVKNYIEEN